MLGFTMTVKALPDPTTPSGSTIEADITAQTAALTTALQVIATLGYDLRVRLTYADSNQKTKQVNLNLHP